MSCSAHGCTIIFKAICRFNVKKKKEAQLHGLIYGKIYISLSVVHLEIVSL